MVIYMICEIISIGTELLTGNTVNTNTAYIARKLMELGVNMYHQSVVGDNPARLSAQLIQALDRADIIITTGGLGPTYDDLSKDVVAQVLGKTLIENKDITRELEEFYGRLGREMPASNIKQSYMTEDSTVIPNDNGTAPGLIIPAGEGKYVIMLPGPPREVMPMIDGFVFDFLHSLNSKTIRCRNLQSIGYGESTIAQYIEEYSKTAINPSIATYVDNFETTVRITAIGDDEQSALALLDEGEAKVRSLLPEDAIYGVDVQGINHSLVALLQEKNLKIATAESCTAGLLSFDITKVAGSSQVFDCGVCSYGNNIKEELLSVNTLKDHGAVSPETAMAMAEGVLKISSADIAVSTTGIAGPGGGSAQKPVGLVYIGIATKVDGKVSSTAYKYNFGGRNPTREGVRSRSSTTALHRAFLEAKKIWG